MTAFDDAARALDDLMQRVERLEQQVKTMTRTQSGPPRTAYRTREVAEMTGLKTETIQAWIRDGRLEAEDMGGWYAVPAAAAEALVPRRSA
jgi:excisionase family DNA binding protein